MSNTKIKAVSLAGDYLVPTLSETNNRKPYVEIGLEGTNDFFTYLISKYQTSTTNKAAIDGKIDLVNGLGIAFKDNPAMTEYFFKLTSEEDVKSIVTDYVLFGNAAIQVHFTSDRQSIRGFYHSPCNNFRAEKCDDSGRINAYYYSTMWDNPKPGQKATRIPAYNSGDYEGDIQILWVKNYAVGQYYYGIPSYMPALPYCSVEEEIANLHISTILNGFMPLSVINFFGNPDEESMIETERQIMAKFGGSSNAGKVITSWNSSPEEKTQIESIIQPNLHDQYQFISSEAANKILVAHRITSGLLFAIKGDATGFSSNSQEMLTAYEILNVMQIAPIQKSLLNAFKSILEYNGAVADGIYFEPLVIPSIQAQIVESVGQAEADDMATDNQVSEEMSAVNENIKKMTGREFQHLNRIVREFSKGKITEAQAKQMLKASFNLSEEDCNVWLGIIEEEEEEEVTE